MTTLKERFEKELYKTIEAPMKANISTADIRVSAMSTTELGEKVSNILSFFRQELLALAEEVQEYNQIHRKENEYYQEGRDAATELAIVRIRSKANELL
jgi:hypothetical protein